MVSIDQSIDEFQFKPKKRLASLPDPIRRLLINPLAFIGLLLLLIFGFMAIAAPYLAPPDQWERRYMMPRDGFSQTPKPPNAEAWATFPPNWKLHPMGTTQGQYDLYYGLVWGARSAWGIALIVIALSLSIGLLMGIPAGYFGGMLDNIIMRFTDIMLIFPFVVWAITLFVIFSHPVEIFGQSIRMDRVVAVIVAIVTFNWVIYARLIRGDILSVKSKDFIMAARALGGSNWRIVTRHVLPNAIYPLLIYASLDVGTIVLNIAFLSFLGLGPPAGFADWGQLISFSRQYVIGSLGQDPFAFWYVIAVPGLAITLFVLAWNLVGDAVRDVMDPRLRGSRAK